MLAACLIEDFLLKALTAQEIEEKRMERAGLQACRVTFADSRQQGNPFAHLRRRLIGERQQEQLAWGDAPDRQQIPRSADQHRGFAGACPGQRQQRALVMAHCRDLRSVEQNPAFLQPTEVSGIGVSGLHYFAACPGRGDLRLRNAFAGSPERYIVK
ncbi:hypothetical protein D3C81_1655880 [compost metagenome]